MNLPRSLWPPTVHGRWMDEGFVPALVSVIVPTYNRADLLVETLDSVRRQTYRPIELVVVDDGSRDDTPQRVAEWSARHAEDARLEVVFHREPNRGAPAARNLGLILSRGEFIQFLDSDDLLHPDKIALQVAALRDAPELDLVCTMSVRFTGRPDWEAPPYSGMGFPSPLPGCLADFRKFWTTDAAVYRRRTCAENGPWDETLVTCQDWEYHVRMLSGRPRIGHIARALTARRLHVRGRISDRQRTRAAMASRVRAVRRAAAALDAAALLTPQARAALAKRWYRVARDAWLIGCDRIVRQAVEGVRSLGARKRNLERLNLLRLVPHGARADLLRHFDPGRSLRDNARRFLQDLVARFAGGRKAPATASAVGERKVVRAREY